MTLASDSLGLPSVNVSLSNFGPISSGTVNLRPLTVFVGPSNTGKTYLAMLIYALHRSFSGFPRHPLKHRYLMDEIQSSSPEEFDQIARKLRMTNRPFTLSDLPSSVQESMENTLSDPDFHRYSLVHELKRCFSIRQVQDLIQWRSGDVSSEIVLNISENERDLWKFIVKISKQGTSSLDQKPYPQHGHERDELQRDVSTHGVVRDMLLIPTNFSNRKEILDRCLELSSNDLDFTDRMRGLVWQILDTTASIVDEHVHYLPAARSGIMQAYRLIVSSLVSRSSRAGIERLNELPVLSGIVADFVQNLILYDGNIPRKPQNFHDLRAMFRKRVTSHESSLSSLGKALERETLRGKVRMNSSQFGRLPEVMYSPVGSMENIQLNRASSMVAELAPLVLFLNGLVEPGDTLILEEPEAHLHPAAQALIAKTIAKVVQAGVRVVITTHSDWFLKEIGNLILEGELESMSDLPHEDNHPKQDALHVAQVGAWLFRQDSEIGGSIIEEIKFDKCDGIEPTEYERVAEDLYNRSVDLQNRIADPLRRF